jgi:hypothetical protein
MRVLDALADFFRHVGMALVRVRRPLVGPSGPLGRQFGALARGAEPWISIVGDGEGLPGWKKSEARISTADLDAGEPERGNDRLAGPTPGNRAPTIRTCTARRRMTMAKDHGPSVKNDKQYEGLKKKGMSKSRAAAIANSEGSSSRGGKKSNSSGSSKSNAKQGGTSQQKKAAGRKGGKAAAGKS